VHMDPILNFFSVVFGVGYFFVCSFSLLLTCHQLYISDFTSVQVC